MIASDVQFVNSQAVSLLRSDNMESMLPSPPHSDEEQSENSEVETDSDMNMEQSPLSNNNECNISDHQQHDKKEEEFEQEGSMNHNVPPIVSSINSMTPKQ